MPTAARRRWRRAGLAGVLLAALALAATLWLRPAPPALDFAQARAALSQARRAEAAAYAPHHFEQAEAAWARALEAWQRQNDRWFPLRDYRLAAENARTATDLATTAARRAETVHDSLQTAATSNLPQEQARVARLKDQLAGLPFHHALHAALSTAETRLAETQRALERQDYRAAARSLRQATAHADTVGAGVAGLLQRYLADLPAWQRWHAETVAWSARHAAPAIVVDKIAKRCYVYVAGRLHASYPVELGPRWIGDKSQEGDLATPEGRYHVVRKLDAGETIYHRALLINYPNDADRQRFAEAQRRGDLPPEARIGGRIELHGRGGRGADWTKGCVALTNPDMETLFGLARVGTPVTIVGALDGPAFAADGQAGTAFQTKSP